MSQADRAVEAVREARALLKSWYHDPDCSAGRRELQHFEGEKVCFHFDKRLRHQCAEALEPLLAALADADLQRERDHQQLADEWRADMEQYQAVKAERDELRRELAWEQQGTPYPAVGPSES